MSSDDLPLVVLISGGGSNLQAIIDAVARGAIEGRIRAVFSNRPDAHGLKRAQRAGIATEVMAHDAHPRREDFDLALHQRIAAYEPGLVVLAGFMRVLTPVLTRPYAGRMLNIHPSLLPEFRGLHTHQRALDAGVDRHGCSVHFVTDELDGGPVVLQATVPVLPKDTPETLAARVLAREHVIFPLAVRWFCSGRLRLAEGGVYLDDKLCTEPLQLDSLPPRETAAITAEEAPAGKRSEPRS